MEPDYSVGCHRGVPALFPTGTRLDYSSASTNREVRCRVVANREDGSMQMDKKLEYWFTPTEQVERFSLPPLPLCCRFPVGAELEYNSVSQASWLPCRIIAVRKDGAVQINLKVSQWLELDEQDEKLREPAREGIEDLLSQAWALRLRHKFHEAQALFIKVLDQEADNPDALIGLGDVRWDLRDFEGAEPQYWKAYEVDAYDMKVLTKLGYLLIRNASATGNPKASVPQVTVLFSKVRAISRKLDEVTREQEREACK